MRLIQVLHGWPPARMGGTGLYVAALSAALRAEGHEVLGFAPGEAGRASTRPVPGGALLDGPAPRRWEQLWTQPGAADAARAWLYQTRPDVVHIHHLSGLPWSVVEHAREVGARVVLTLHDYALPCARGQLLDRDGRPCPGPEPARCAACVGEQLRNNPLLAQVGRLLARWPRLRAAARAPVQRLPPRPADLRRVEARSAAVARVLGEVHALLSPSHDLADRLVSFGLPRARRCELPLVRPVPPAPQAPPGPIRFLCAAALHPSKGADRALAAFRTLPVGAATLTLAGPDAAVDGHPGWSAALRADAARTPGVTVRGEVAPDDMTALLHAHDVLLLPSRWPENSPLVVREATAAGLRVVISAQGGAAELAPHAAQVGPEDEPALARALEAEVARGRARVEPASWPSPAEHARWLLAAIYRGP